jgi:hypothetical protein
MSPETNIATVRRMIERCITNASLILSKSSSPKISFNTSSDILRVLGWKRLTKRSDGPECLS